MNIENFPNSNILSTSQFIHILQCGLQNHERFCFILGSGASVESGIPMGGTLEKYWMDCLMGKSKDWDDTPPFNRKDTINLAKKLKADDPENLQHDFNEIIQDWEKANKEDLNVLSSQYYFDLYKIRFFPNYRHGYHYLEKIMDKSEPSIGYRILAELLAEEKIGSNLVITTNFDSLVEDSLFIYTDKKPLVINHEALAEYLSTPNIIRPIVAKIHRGLYFAPLNKSEEVNKLKDEWRPVLQQALKNYTPIVIGYGGGDHTLMELFSESSTKMPNGIYWCFLDEYGMPNKTIQEILIKHKGCFVKSNGFDSFMFEIGQVLFKEKINVDNTADYLKRQYNNRAIKYQQDIEKFMELKSEPYSAQTFSNNQSFIEAMEASKIEQAVRERTNTLTEWDYLFKAKELLNLNKAHEAIELLSKATELNPDLYIIYTYRASAYAALEKYTEAIEDYTRAIKLNPKNDTIYTNRGAAYDSLEKYMEAIEDYTKAIELNPKNDAAYNNRGAAYKKLKKYEEAVADYTKAIELNPQRAPTYNNRGDLYTIMKKFEEAIEDYTKAIGLNPKNALFYNNRGGVYNSLEQHEKAINDYTQAIKLNSKNATIYNNRGTVYDSLGKYEKAIDDYTKAIELDPKNDTTYNNRGATYDSLGKYTEAIKDYTKAIELNPKNDAAYNNRGFAYDSLEKYTEAIKDYTEAIELNPQDEISYNNRGATYKSLKIFEKAIEDLTYAIRLNATAPGPHRHLGDVYALQMRNNESIAEYSLAIALDSKYKEAYKGRASVYRKLGENEEAARDEEIVKKL